MTYQLKQNLTGYPNMYPPVEVIKPLPVDIFPNVVGRYWVSNYGNVFTTDQFGGIKMMSLNIKPNGYYIVQLATYDGKPTAFHVHRLVLMTFNYILGCEKFDVNHIDSVRTHNWLWNLEWVTRRDNIRHALNHGRMGYGENSTAGKYEDTFIRQICEEIEAGVSKGIIATKYNIPYNTVYQIYRGNTWLHISKDYTFITEQYSKYFNADQLGQIFDIINKDPSMAPHNILLKLGIDAINLDKPYDRILPNLVNKMRYDLGLPLVI